MTTTTTTTTADLLNAVLASDNLRRAWARVKSNHGAPGMDGVTIEDFPAGSRAHWPALRQQIASGRYQSQPVRRVDIPKPGGGTRLLGIRTVMDRVIQQAIAQVLTPLFDPGFSASSFGFRPGRNAHQAIRQVQGLVTHGYRWAVDLDLAKFFDTVNHDQLMARPARVFTDRRLLALLGRSLRARVQVGEHHIEPSEVGTPQGGPLSPLLANILLDAFDTELHRRGHRFARYADDVVILVRSQRAVERVMRSLTQFLHTRLKLSVNPATSRVALMSDCSFLTFTIKGKKIRWADSALLAFKHRGEELTGRSWGVSMVHRLKKLAPYLRGWFGYFGVS